MTTTDDGQLIAYLKANNLYGHLAAAAGVKKDATAGDVHATSSDTGTKRTVSVAYTEVEHVPAAPAPKTKAADDEDDEEDDTVDVGKRAVAAGDLVFEKGTANLYASRPLTDGSAERLHDWAVEHGIQNIVPPELMHVTQIHSTAEVEDSLTPLATLVDVPADGRWLSQLGKGNALVMFFQSPELQARFLEATAAGASWDFPSFMPHITISYDTGDVQAAGFQMMAAPDFPLQLGPEEFKADDPNWTADNNLVSKGDGGDFEFTIDVSKADVDKQMIFGWASITHIDGKLVVDKQDDAILLVDTRDGDGTMRKGLESAAYDFVLYSRMHGEMHSQIGTGKLCESMVFTPEKADLGIIAKNEDGQTLFGWWTGFYLDNAAVWKRAKAGKLPEFSIGGRATSSVI